MERHDLDIGPALDAWLADLRLADASPATVKTYRSLTRPLLDLETVNLVTDAEARAILLAYRDKHPASVYALYTALASFFRWCIQRHYLAASPLADVPKPRRRTPPHRYLTEAQLAAIYQACEDDAARLMVRLLCCGMRAGELTAATWRAYDAESRILRLTVTKGRKPRLVPLDAAICALLDAMPRTSERIFPITVMTLETRIHKLTVRAGISNVTPHTFRHSWASQWLLHGGDSAALQTLGGWSNQQMVRRYAASALEESAVRAARQADLGSKLFGE